MQSRKKVKNYLISMDNLLGQGAFSSVYVCHSATNPELRYAVKVIDKKQRTHGNKKSSRELVHALKNKNIVELVEMHETVNNIYIVQECCDGTTLKQLIKSKGTIQQSLALNYISQITQAFGYLLQKGIIHRDLKPENILISSCQSVLKLADFGFAKQIASQNQTLTSIVGSPIYMAPQILRGQKYNSKCDVWSYGIILYEMLYGEIPWKGNGSMTSVGLLRKILQEPLKFPNQPFVDKNVKQFIQECLLTDEKQRISWLQILEHSLFQQNSQIKLVAKNYRKNAQSAVNLLNHLSNKIKPCHLVGAFLQFKTKALDFKTFHTIIKSYLIPQSSQQQISLMYQMFDKDCNGVIDIEQFVKAFQICDEQILKLLNILVGQGMFYQDLIDQNKFQIRSQQIGQFDQQTISGAYAILKEIRYEEG